MAALSSPAVAFLAVLGVAGTLPIIRRRRRASAERPPAPGRGQGARSRQAAGGGAPAPNPNFGNAVILLADFNDDGAVGLVVNRRSDVTVARVFPHLTPTLASAGQAFLGGPVEKTRPMVLLRASASPAEARRVLDGVYLLTVREAMESAVSSNTVRDISASTSATRVGPGQLEAETAEGVWHVLAGDADAVFDPDPSSTWRRRCAHRVIQAE